MFKAVKSFCGKVSMAEGDVREISDKALAKALLKDGFIEEIKAEAEPKKEKKTKKKDS